MQDLHSDGLDYLQQAPKSGPVQQIIVLLHGYGRSAHLMQKMADELASRLPQALIVMPHAPEEYEDHNDDGNALQVPEQLRSDDPDSYAPGMRRKWFSISGADITEVTRRVHDVTATLNDFISGLMAQHHLTESNVAVMGFSQGGVVALYSAYSREKPFACVVGHSTIFLGGKNLHSTPPTLYLYGLDDEEFTPARYEESAAYVKAHVSETTIRAIPKLRHTTNAESRVIVADYIVKKFLLSN